MRLLEWLKRHSPRREAMERHRWLRPFAHTLGDPTIWRFNRHSVARGVALGLFFGLIIPFGQVLMAALFAVTFRANLAVAALCTLVTNPLTFPFIYLAAYEVGARVLRTEGARDAFAEVQSQGWLDGFLAALGNAPAPVAVGLLLLSVVSATAGYAAIQVLWKIWVGRRLHARRTARIGRAD